VSLGPQPKQRVTVRYVPTDVSTNPTHPQTIKSRPEAEATRETKPVTALLDGHGLGQVARPVDVEPA
jgi:hypothetical protein